MKIALLNLPLDNNYGGNLQRYALMKVLQDMGHDVTHLSLRFNFNPNPYYYQCYLILRRLASRILKRSRCPIIPEYRRQQTYNKSCAVTNAFYNRYIKHTKSIYSKKQLSKYLNYDAFLVGSDQVWRKMIASSYGIPTFFFDYLPSNLSAKRIAYGVSLGTSENELNKDDLGMLTPLYQRFDAVSVRENSALDLLHIYQWELPKAIQVLDPTLLLGKEDYSHLIDDGFTQAVPGNLFCYILDMTKEKGELISKMSTQKGLTPFVVSLNPPQPTVEQWLRSFRDSEYIVTDSFHGLVFATIFNKPFTLIQNEFRGNARFCSLISTIYRGTNIEMPDWMCVNTNIKYWKDISLAFLKDNLS